MIPLNHILVFSGALFCIGLLGLSLQRNILRLLLAIEAMLNGAALGFIGTAIHYNQVEGHLMFILILAVAAAEVGVALSLLLHCDRLFHNLNIASVDKGK
jgi:NADH-quinone oxidoreductase subunit K